MGHIKIEKISILMSSAVFGPFLRERKAKMHEIHEFQVREGPQNVATKHFNPWSLFWKKIYALVGNRPGAGGSQSPIARKTMS